MDPPAFENDHRYKAGMRLRRAGRFEAAASLLAEVMAVATEGKDDAAQNHPALAPLHRIGQHLIELRAAPLPPRHVEV